MNSSFAPARQKQAAWALLLLGILAFVGKGYKDEQAALHFRDFKQPYASARCVLHGCDPYAEAPTREQFLEAGGVDEDATVFQAYSSLYPPPSLVMLTPVAALRYPAAHELWFVVIALLFSLASAAVAELSLSFLGGGTAIVLTVVLAAFIFSSTILLMLGQITGPVVSLLVIGAWLLIHDRLRWLAVLCLTAALLLKPHDSLLIVGLYLLVAGARWRRAWLAVMALALVFTAGSLAWFQHSPATSHWTTELPANLKGNTSSGNVNDATLSNLQASEIADLKALVGTVTPSPRLATLGELGGSAILLLLWIVPVVRMRDTRTKHVLALAALSAITLLLIYHRQYDTRLLLLVFPATALLLARRRGWGLAALALTAVASVITSHKYGNFLVVRQTRLGSETAAQALVSYRPLPEIELLLALFFIAALWMAQAQEQRGQAL
jgi:hypothetical protein